MVKGFRGVVWSEGDSKKTGDITATNNDLSQLNNCGQQKGLVAPKGVAVVVSGIQSKFSGVICSGL